MKYIPHNAIKAPKTETVKGYLWVNGTIDSIHFQTNFWKREQLHTNNTPTEKSRDNIKTVISFDIVVDDNKFWVLPDCYLFL